MSDSESDNEINKNKTSETIINKMITKKSNINSLIPWIEKYRPKKIKHILTNELTMKKLLSMTEQEEIPNLIITGIPGIGKTTTILCLAKQLYGKYYDQAVLELNASDDRGIKTVQGPMNAFCKKKMFMVDDNGNEIKGRHKFIVLDEADNITKKAQQLIANLMEKYNETTRFAFTCNNSTDIIEAIQSRCQILRYQRIDSDLLAKRLKYICKKENVDYKEDAIINLSKIANGDMRHAINNLQAIHTCYGKVTIDNIYKLCDLPHPVIINSIFQECINKKLMGAIEQLNKLKEYGCSYTDIVHAMINFLKNDDSLIEDKCKIAFMREISRTCMIVNKGVSTELQLDACLARLCC